MRILIASDLHWPTINGVATFGRNLAHGLAARGHDVLVVAPSQTGKRYEETDRNHKVARTASLQFPFYQNFRISVSPYSEVKKIIGDFKPDVIHIQSPLGIGRAALGVGKKFGIPVVATNHAMPENLIENLKLLAPFARPINYILKEYGERFYGNADYITLPTQAAIKMFDKIMEEVQVPVKAVSNGIDLSRFKPARPNKTFKQRFGIPDKPIIMYVGRLDGEKHIQTLIKAAQRVLAELEVHVVIIGHGSDAENLKSLAERLDIAKHITFTGRVEDVDLPKLQACGDVFAMPSPAELQCIAMLEAMACGQATVAVNVGAVYELCQDGRNGYLAEVDNDEDMATKLLKILSDKKLHSNMSKESIAIAKTHDLGFTLTQFEQIYQQLVDAHTVDR
jgi:glycosyltransferase involved in cell wall biosynthesis